MISYGSIVEVPGIPGWKLDETTSAVLDRQMLINER